MSPKFSTTTIAMLLCLLGCATPLLPWAEVTVLNVNPIPQADGTYKLLSRIDESYAGYRFWHGVASASVFLGLFLFLLVVGPLQPVPWWRSAVVLSGGAAALIIAIVGLNDKHAALASEVAGGRLVSGRLGIMNQVVMGLGVGLMVVAALEMRARIASTKQAETVQDGAP